MTSGPNYDYAGGRGGTNERLVPRQVTLPGQPDVSDWKLMPKDGIPLAELVAMPMPPAIFDALIAIKVGIASVNRDSQDSENGREFKYASVDAIYEATRALCAEAKLVILPLELEAAWLPAIGEAGPKMRIVFQFIAQAGAEIWTHPFWRKTVISPYEGSKTTIAMESMAMKSMLRTLFQISTGEADPADAPRLEGPKPGTFSLEANRSETCMRLSEQILELDSLDALNRWLGTNETAIGQMGKVEQALISTELVFRRKAIQAQSGITPEGSRKPVNTAAKRGGSAGKEEQADTA